MTTTTLRHGADRVPHAAAGRAADRWTRASTSHAVVALRAIVGVLVWRPLLALVAPVAVRVEGPLPAGPCVVVAEHRSHADTVALRTALRRLGRRRVVAAAAEDYWFSRPGRAWGGVVLAGAVPFPRSGQEGLERVAALLEDGWDVIVYPQGSRRADARTWRSGVGRLAVEHGATLLPVRIEGTDRLLGYGRRGLRPAAIGITVGGPVLARPGRLDTARAVTDRARHAATALPAASTREPWPRRLSARLRTTAASRGWQLLACWAFAEALVWPLVPDVALAGMVLAAPWLAGRFCAATALASAAGGVVALVLGRAGHALPLLAVTERMQAGAAAAVAEHGARGVLQQPLSGIPYKAFTAAAASLPIDAPAWALWTLVARGARMAVVAVVAAVAGRLLWRRVPATWRAHLHVGVVAVGAPAFLVGWSIVAAGWR